ncbi:MAG: chloride channel protein, partial [Planctomycetota bacterium]
MSAFDRWHLPPALQRSLRRVLERAGFQSNWYLVVLAAGIGTVTAIGAWGFTWLLQGMTWLFLGWWSGVSAHGHSTEHEHAVITPADPGHSGTNELVDAIGAAGNPAIEAASDAVAGGTQGASDTAAAAAAAAATDVLASGDPGLVSGWLVYVLLVAAPVIGALCCGLIVYFGAPEARGHGVPEVMIALYRKKGQIRPQVALFKSIASAFTIGSGGSAGAEGPIVQIGSAIGSNLGRYLRVSPEHNGTLLGCGAAAGIAAVF